MLAAALTVASAFYYASYRDYGLNPFDEGYLVSSALRVHDGQLPYRDFHHVYAPGRFYFTSLLLDAFGMDLVAVRTAFLGLRAVANGLFFLIACELLPAPAALLAVLPGALVPGPWWKADFALASAALLWTMLYFLRRPSAALAGVAGALTGAALYFRQDAAGFGVVAFLFTLALGSKKNSTRGLSPT